MQASILILDFYLPLKENYRREVYNEMPARLKLGCIWFGHNLNPFQSSLSSESFKQSRTGLVYCYDCSQECFILIKS